MTPAGAFIRSGKVRDLYAVGADRLLLVASDRLSAFDVVLPTPVPDKGMVLTGLSRFWFAETAGIVPNHLIATDPAALPPSWTGRADELRGRMLLCRRVEILPVECVVRGYLAGGGWKEYAATGAVSGIRLAAGLREAERLPAPIFTPSTKAEAGHDEPISFDALVDLLVAPRRDQQVDQRVEGDRLVGASLGLRGGREDGGGEPFCLAQPSREPDAGDCAGRCVLLPAAPGEVPPDDALDRQDLHAPAEQHPTAQLVRATGPRRWECRRIRRDEMVGHDPGRLREPEPRQPGEHHPLVRDRRRQHDVEGGQPIRGDEQESVRAHRVQVTDLAGADECPRRRHRTIPGSMASRRAMTVGPWVRTVSYTRLTLPTNR